MVARIQLTHLIHCDVEAYWRDFADDAFNQQLFVAEMGYPSYRVLERRDDGERLWRRIEITPKVHLPEAVRQIVGPALTFVEEGELDGARYRFRFVAPAGRFAADKATSEGVIHAERAEGGTKRVLDLNCEIRLFGVGRMLEAAATKIAQDAYNGQAAAWNALLAKRG
jgi:hypothetical protein